MKKTVLTLTASAFIAGIILTACSTPAKRVENAENNVAQANSDLDKANEEYLTDIEKCRKETAEKVSANEGSIAELKARRDYVKNEAKDDYDRQIAELERKDKEMKRKMDDYKAEGKEKWESFKADFTESMDELGKSIKDLMASNKKQDQVQ